MAASARAQFVNEAAVCVAARQQRPALENLQSIAWVQLLKCPGIEAVDDLFAELGQVDEEISVLAVGLVLDRAVAAALDPNTVDGQRAIFEILDAPEIADVV